LRRKVKVSVLQRNDEIERVTVASVAWLEEEARAG